MGWTIFDTGGYIDDPYIVVWEQWVENDQFVVNFRPLSVWCLIYIRNDSDSTYRLPHHWVWA